MQSVEQYLLVILRWFGTGRGTGRPLTPRPWRSNGRDVSRLRSDQFPLHRTLKLTDVPSSVRERTAPENP
jgi:hypothetical protein